MFEKKSLGIYKKRELYDRLWNFLTEAAVDQKPFLWFTLRSPRNNFKPTEEEIDSLTRPIEVDEYLRSVSPADCREWALENWSKIIAEGKEILQSFARGVNDTDFLAAIEGLEKAAKNARARKRK